MSALCQMVTAKHGGNIFRIFRETILPKMWRAIGVYVILMVIISSCTKDTAVYKPCPDCPSNISFSSAIIPIFKASCAITGCHTGPASSAPGRISLDSAIAYAQATHGGTGYVVGGNANYSLLYNQLQAGAPNHMPVGGQLDACDIQKIQCWIDQGALDN